MKQYDVRQSLYSGVYGHWINHLAVFVITNPSNPDVDVYYFETLGM